MLFRSILFYDMVGEKKKKITEALAERRAAEAADEPGDDDAENAEQDYTKDNTDNDATDGRAAE